MYYTALRERICNGWRWRPYRALQQMFQSCIVRRDISHVSVFLLASAKKNAKLPAVPQPLLAHAHSEGSILRSPCNEWYVSHMCRRSGMLGTSVLLNTGPTPIEMAYHGRYVWKNSFARAACCHLPRPPLSHAEKKKKSLSPRPSPSSSILPSLPPLLLPLSISVSSWRYANRCVSISCQIITIY